MPKQEDYPLTLRAPHIAEIMDIALPTAYTIMEWKGFPLIRFGRSKRVHRDAFFEWFRTFQTDTSKGA